MVVQDAELRLVAALQQWRVPFLTAPDASVVGPPMEATALIAGLIGSQSPRLHLAITAFFLVHPEEGPVLLKVLPMLRSEQGRVLKCYYMAALYLQLLWASHWRQAQKNILMDDYSYEIDGPPPITANARWGLSCVEEQLQLLMQQPYNYMASFEALARLVIQAERTDS